MTARRRRLTQAGAVAVAMAFALAACGNSNSGGTSSSAGKDAARSAPATSVGSGATPASGSTDPGSGQSGGEPVSQPAGAYDFCRLVSSAEAEAILGKPAKDARRTSSKTTLGPVGSCAYLSTDYTLKSQSIVNVIYLGNKITRAQYDQETSDLRANAKPVAGLGESAIFIPGLIAVFDHGVAMTVQVIKGSVPADLALLTALAHKTLERTGEVR